MQHETGIKVASSIWILAMPTPLIEKILSFLHWSYLLTCQTLIDHMWVGLILCFLFCSIDLFNYSGASGPSLFGLYVSGCDRVYIEILGGCRIILLRVNAIFVLPNIQKTVEVSGTSLNTGMAFNPSKGFNLPNLPSPILYSSVVQLHPTREKGLVLELALCLLLLLLVMQNFRLLFINS